uniref:Putative Sm-like protein n=1 Tax=Trypanosoma congolense (strain IL3000) TaxID=1068625 RepID=G0UTJ5_TRYCI|nr:putative Sm-like protein [Trypanosoma congolense IL3000]
MHQRETRHSVCGKCLVAAVVSYSRWYINTSILLCLSVEASWWCSCIHYTIHLHPFKLSIFVLFQVFPPNFVGVYLFGEQTLLGEKKIIVIMTTVNVGDWIQKPARCVTVFGEAHEGLLQGVDNNFNAVLKKHDGESKEMTFVRGESVVFIGFLDTANCVADGGA